VYSYNEELPDVVVEEMTFDERKAHHAENVRRRMEETLQDPDFIAWRDECVKFAQRRHGAERMAFACVHVDEASLHMHIVFHNHGFSVKPMIAGCDAARDLLENDAPRKQIQAALNGGKKKMLDDFHSEVGVKFGTKRISQNPRKRKSPADYKNDLAMAEAAVQTRRILRAAELEAANTIANAQKRASEIGAKALVDKEATFMMMEAEISRIKANARVELDARAKTIQVAQEKAVLKLQEANLKIAAVIRFEDAIFERLAIAVREGLYKRAEAYAVLSSMSLDARPLNRLLEAST
jgi:hypothetical protein